MKVEDVATVAGSIQDIRGDREGIAKADQLSKRSAESLRIAEENIAASMVRLNNVTAAAELLKQLQAQIADQPGTALLAQANIEAAKVAALLG